MDSFFNKLDELAAEYGALLARILLSILFLVSGVFKFLYLSQTAAVITAAGLPFGSLLAILSGALELLAGLSVILGYKTKISSFVLFFYVIVVNVVFHLSLGQIPMLEKNLAIMGGLVYLYMFGPGHLSLDVRKKMGGEQSAI